MVSQKQLKDAQLEIADNWRQNRCSSMAAAIAFRSLFSLVPLVYLATVIVQRLNTDFLVSELVGLANQIDTENQLEGLQKVATVLPDSTGWSVVFWVLGLLILLIGATSVFNELYISVNVIWGRQKRRGLKYLLRQRLVSVGVMVVLAALLVGAFFLRSLLWMVDDVLVEYLDLSVGLQYWLGWWIGPLLTYLFVVGVNAMLPRKKLQWHDVLIPNLVTLPLFVVGQVLLGWYLSSFGVGSDYGNFAGFVVFMVWVYYSAIILLFSVQVTKVYAENWGRGKKSKLRTQISKLQRSFKGE